MTEQPVEHEQQFLGNPVPPAAKLQAYLPNGHRLPIKPHAVKVDLTVYEGEGELGDLAAGRTDLLLEAEVHANHAVKSLENGTEGLDAGIAWLQSALAFALNARHGRDLAGGAI
jgi:hypothetical protein